MKEIKITNNQDLLKYMDSLKTQEEKKAFMLDPQTRQNVVDLGLYSVREWDELTDTVRYAAPIILESPRERLARSLVYAVPSFVGACFSGTLMVWYLWSHHPWYAATFVAFFIVNIVSATATACFKFHIITMDQMGRQAMLDLQYRQLKGKDSK